MPSRLMASPLLPAFLMNVGNAPVAGSYRRTSAGWTFCGPVPSYMVVSSRVSRARVPRRAFEEVEPVLDLGGRQARRGRRAPVRPSRTRIGGWRGRRGGDAETRHR
ncbi:hypothetical protein [Kibdelosporangium phytohabitans]|uniref:hypothetical protein n=1 Tax=Kibdelosporangium phytohabitans TaxID=860235 RepID=UPI0012F78E4D|nr:hypothetical protein [Kibdelosporangium phytohabitans]MBE1470504.1 hypothetical protein [Kibdelosporangium phytohabitans]